MKKSINETPTELAEAAFEQAARKVVERALQMGTPVIVWKNGAIHKVPPQEIRLPKRRRGKRKAC